MKVSKPFLIAIACAAFAAGCNRNTGPEATTPAATPDAGITADAPAPIAEEKHFTMEAFAGAFSADGNTITLNADGTYISKMGDASSDGTWTADEAGSELLLDPNSKAAADSKYAVVSDNEIRALDGRMSLQRDGAPK